MLVTISLLSILPSLAYGSKILGVFSVPSISHQKPFYNLAKELSLRGHEVTIITTNPLRDKSLTNLTEIDTSFLYELLQRKGGFEQIVAANNTLWQQMNKLRDYFDFAAEGLLKNREVHNLLNSDKSFDVVIVESHDPIFFAFGQKFCAPVIGKLIFFILIYTYRMVSIFSLERNIMLRSLDKNGSEIFKTILCLFWE